MRVQDLILVARKVRVITRFRTTVGRPGTLSTRLQPNHPVDDAAGIAAAMVDGLLLGSGDAVVGINPASDNVGSVQRLLELIDHVRQKYAIPIQSCVLAHVSTLMAALRTRRTGRPGFSVDCGYGGGKPFLWRESEPAGGSVATGEALKRGDGVAIT